MLVDKGDIMQRYKTKCVYGYSILGECPPKLDSTAEYIIVARSKFFSNCIVVQRADGEYYNGKRVWIIPETSIY